MLCLPRALEKLAGRWTGHFSLPKGLKFLHVLQSLHWEGFSTELGYTGGLLSLCVPVTMQEAQESPQSPHPQFSPNQQSSNEV